MVVTLKDSGGSNILVVTLIYPGSGSSITVDIGGTQTEFADAILDTRARIVHLHITCSNLDFKVHKKYLLAIKIFTFKLKIFYKFRFTWRIIS